MCSDTNHLACITTRSDTKSDTKSDTILRPYQQECIDTIKGHPRGAFLIYMATGLGKTVTMSQIPFERRMLILSHREELVRQPQKYFSCSFGMEQAKNTSHGEQVVSASVQSLVRRLDKFKPDDFDVIVTDEAHHAVANTYQKIYDYFKPRLHLGFTATPNRTDAQGLDSVFEDIIFERNLQWGIKNGYLSDIKCIQADVGFDLEGVEVTRGDYDPEQLEKAVNFDDANNAILEAYMKYATPPVLIFCVGVDHARALADLIPGAVAVAGGEPREEILKKFSAGEIPCICNCMVFTEGTDLPNIRTVIIARPTQSMALYAQMAGRGTRVAPGKPYLTLIDCVGGETAADAFCTAPSLIGIDPAMIPKRERLKLDGNLLDIPDKVKSMNTNVESFVKGFQVVDILRKKMKVNTHGLRFCCAPDGSWYIPMSDPRVIIPKPDELGRVPDINGKLYKLQRYIDAVYKWLNTNHVNKRPLWSVESSNSWTNEPATVKQKRYLHSTGIDMATLTKGEASLIISGLQQATLAMLAK